MGVDPDIGPYDNQPDEADDSGLPDHELDETRRETDARLEDEVEDAGLPAHEDDSRSGEDTGAEQQNP